MSLSLRSASVLFLLLALPLACRQAAAPADPARAREALRLALDAWQKGDKPEALKSGSPSVTVVEPLWQSGVRLLKYEIAEKEQFNGFDLQLRATLWLEAAGGKSYQEKAIYHVSTHPALVVVRSEPG